MKQIRLWKLGNLEHKIFPSPEIIKKFSDMLTDAVSKANRDMKNINIVWDDAISVELITIDNNAEDIVVSVEENKKENDNV